MTINACAGRDIRKEIEADIWNIDYKDGSIYRIVEENGKKREEFIYCTDKSARLFKAIHKDDLKKWLDEFYKNCSCKGQTSLYGIKLVEGSL